MTTLSVSGNNIIKGDAASTEVFAGGLTLLEGSPNSTVLRSNGAIRLNLSSQETSLYDLNGFSPFNYMFGTTTINSASAAKINVGNDMRISMSVGETSIVRPVVGGSAIEMDEWNLRLRTANGNTVFYAYNGELVMYQPTGGGDVLRANSGSVCVSPPGVSNYGKGLLLSPEKATISTLNSSVGFELTQDTTYLSAGGVKRIELNNAGVLFSWRGDIFPKHI
ncbi:MAG: hypothetical protein LBV41_11085 [Cytophagaceae bacterium]|jgi:hypothetical protein|nr:hypothetical protein [Cytophagaceae bacterium]